MIYNTINEYLDRSFQEYRDNIAISYPERGKSYTYGEMERIINRFARSLVGIGVKNQSHVAIVLPTCPEWVMLFLAITKIGAIPVCLNDSDMHREMEYKINHSDSTVLFTTRKLYDSVIKETKLRKIEKIVIFGEKSNGVTANYLTMESFLKKGETVSEKDVEKCVKATSFDDVLNLQYTSGTTGNPKAVMSIHYRVLNNILVFLKNFQYGEQDKVLSALPLYHVMGCLFTGILIFFAGGTLVLVSHYKTRKVLEIIEKEGCTSFHGVPTMFHLMLKHCDEYKITTLKKCMAAGDYCSPILVDDIMNKLHIEHVFPCYGQSEGIGITQALIEDSIEKKRYTVGKAVKDVEIRIIDEKGNILPANEVGEIIAFIPYHMKGYYKDEISTNKTIKSGWLYTGDLGYLDEDGYLVMKGRKKELIIRGGENISPVEVENVLRQHEDIANVAVVGVPDPVMGEEIAAFVMLEQISEKEHVKVKESLHDYMEKRIPKYERPKFIYIVDQFPMTTSGKIQKKKLVETLQENE